LEDIYGSNLSFVVSALPHVSKLLVRNLDQLLASSTTLVIAQKPDAETMAKLQASGMAILDLTRVEIKRTAVE
jgi:GDP-mannose 6-dehydrogenase